MKGVFEKFAEVMAIFVPHVRKAALDDLQMGASGGGGRAARKEGWKVSTFAATLLFYLCYFGICSLFLWRVH